MQSAHEYSSSKRPHERGTRWRRMRSRVRNLKYITSFEKGVIFARAGISDVCLLLFMTGAWRSHVPSVKLNLTSQTLSIRDRNHSLISIYATGHEAAAAGGQFTPFFLSFHKPFHPQVRRLHSPNLPKEKCINEVMRNGSIVIFHLSTLWKPCSSCCVM